MRAIVWLLLGAGNLACIWLDIADGQWPWAIVSVICAAICAIRIYQEIAEATK